MRFLLIILLFPFIAFSQSNWYVSKGSGASDLNSGASGSPFLTFTKAYTSASANDTINLAAGYNYRGGDTLTKNLYIRRWGSSSNPRISGGDTITSWTNEGGGIYSAPVSIVEERLRILYFDGVRTGKGRSHDVTEVNSYTSGMFIPDGVSTTTVTDSIFDGKNYTGAEIVNWPFSSEPWERDVLKVVSHAGSILTYAAFASGLGQNISGYIFLQNDTTFLDNLGEWSYNKTAGKLFVYFGSELPSNHTVVVPVKRYGFYINGATVKIKGVDFQLSNNDELFFNNAPNSSVDSCKIWSAGLSGIYIFTGSHNTTVSNCTITETGYSGIQSQNANNVIAENNTIHSLSLIDGESEINWIYTHGINLMSGNNFIIRNNTVYNLAYSGIAIQETDSSQIYKNHVYNFCRRNKDGGGIYFHNFSWYYNGGVGKFRHNNRIYSNIVDNSMMYSRDDISSIYFDDGANGASGYNNFVTGTHYGITAKSFDSISYEGNLVYDVSDEMLSIWSNSGRTADEPIDSTLTVKHNTFIRKAPFNDRSPDYFHSYYSVGGGSTSRYGSNEVITKAGKIDSNLYIIPIGEGMPGVRLNSHGGSVGYLGLKGWQQRYGHEVNSTVRLPRLPFVDTTSTTSLSSNIINTFNANLTDFSGNGTVTVAPETDISSLNNSVITWDGSSPLDGGAAKITYTSANDTLKTTDNGIKVLVARGTTGAAGNYYQFNCSIYATASADVEVWIPSYTNKRTKVWFSLNAGRNEIRTQLYTDQAMNYVFLRFVKQSAAPFWVDNIEARQISGTAYDPDDYLTFYKNPTDTIRTVTLDRPYLNLQSNTIKTDTVKIQPWSAVVLMDTTGGATPANTSPTANAGSDQTITLPTAAVTLSGSGSDAETSVTYAWTRVSGPNTPTIVSASSASTSVTGLIEGTYVFRLTVTDGGSLTATDDITITVNPAAPVGPSIKAHWRLLTNSTPSTPTADEFVSFPSWATLTATGVAATDRANLQAAFDTITRPLILSGNFLINATIYLTAKENIAIVGLHPDSTSIKWTGAASDTMIVISGVAYSRLFQRMTLDGDNIANTIIYQNYVFPVGVFDTGNEYESTHFKNANYGIKGGYDAITSFAETVVRRCKFTGFINSAIATGNLNALDLWVWDSYFENNGTCISNAEGGGSGNFHAYRNIFKNTIGADMQMGNTEGFSARENYSIGSTFFFYGGFSENTAQIILQGNTILDNDIRAVSVNNYGPLILLDNKIRGSDALYFGPDQPTGELILIGNKYSSASPITNTAGRLLQVDDLTSQTITATEPTFSYQSRSTSPVIEVTSTIQAAVNSAYSLYNGQKPIVHFSGTKSESVTLSGDVQLVGDGYDRSTITGSVTVSGTATLKDIKITGAVTVANTFFADQLQCFFSGITHNSGETTIVNSGIAYGSDTAVEINGGTVHLFASQGSNANNQIAVNSGSAFLTDYWYENGTKYYLSNLTNGTLFINGARLASPTSGVNILNNTGGTLTVIGANIDDDISASDSTLLLGNYIHTSPYLTTSIGAAQSLYSRGTEQSQMTNIGDGNTSFITQMLAGRKGVPVMGSNSIKAIRVRIENSSLTIN